MNQSSDAPFPSPSPSPHYAGFWIRTLAVIIDTVIILPPLMAILYGIYGESLWGTERLVLGFWDVFLNYVLPFLLTIYFWRKFEGTPGKMILKLHVVDAETLQTLSTGKAILRFFAYIPAMMPLFIGIIWVALDEKKRGWHDRISGTVVIRGDKNQQK